MGAPAASLPSNRRLLLYFFFLAALLPEAITGSTPPLAWLNPIQLLLNLWLYGTGVLVVRELSLRWRTGWPGILLMGAAYGIIEEGLALGVRPPLRSELGVGRLAHDLPRDRQHRLPHLSHRMALSGAARETTPVGTWTSGDRAPPRPRHRDALRPRERSLRLCRRGGRDTGGDRPR